MKITAKSWNEYTKKLSKLNQKAGALMREYIGNHGTDDTKALMDYAMALIQKYGEGSAELACQMYDSMAEMAGVSLPSAEPAEVASYKEVAKMVNATQESPLQMERAVSRMVKRAGADTTLKNAIRDKAEFAWVPHGDTCSFCITLASRGWQRASADVLKGNHAEHIHSNCDCEYAIRFSKNTDVEGYDPDKYLEQYKSAEGKNTQAKINAMRRENYAKNRDSINARKRELYAKEKENQKSLTIKEEAAVVRYISPDAYLLNDKLRRNANSELTNIEREWIKNLDNALEKLPSYKGNLNRSVTFLFEEDAQKYFDEFDVEKEYIPKQYLSTTKSGVYNDDAQVQIYIQNAKNGKDLKGLNDTEKEVLYPYMTKFKVISKIKEGGKFYILLEESE